MKLRADRANISIKVIITWIKWDILIDRKLRAKEENFQTAASILFFFTICTVYANTSLDKYLPNIYKTEVEGRT